MSKDSDGKLAVLVCQFRGTTAKLRKERSREDTPEVHGHVLVIQRPVPSGISDEWSWSGCHSIAS